MAWNLCYRTRHFPIASSQPRDLEIENTSRETSCRGAVSGLPAAFFHGGQAFLEEVLHAGLLDAHVRVAALVEDASLAEGYDQEGGCALAGGVVAADRLRLLDEAAVACLRGQTVGLALEEEKVWMFPLP